MDEIAGLIDVGNKVEVAKNYHDLVGYNISEFLTLIVTWLRSNLISPKSSTWLFQFNPLTGGS